MLRRYVGICLYDLPVIMLPALKSSNMESGLLPWTWLHNRGENLVRNRGGKGVRCDWEGGSDLYLPKVLPACGRWLYRRALQDFPVRFSDMYKDERKQPDVSFIIGHRGLDRLPLLVATLQTIASQVGCRIECIVIEQDNERKIRDYLPQWVRYIHAPLENEKSAFSRGSAFNAGASAARSELLVFHDGDMLVPQDYAREALKHYRKGYEFINLKRFIFYLTQKSSELIISKRSVNADVEFDAVVQNLIGGASLAISRSAYFQIGGFDERFVGWGFEDLEFMDRAGILKEYLFNYLPFVHLWHKAQEGKWTSHAPGFVIYNKVSKIPVPERIKYLRDVNHFDV